MQSRFWLKFIVVVILATTAIAQGNNKINESNDLNKAKESKTPSDKIKSLSPNTSTSTSTTTPTTTTTESVSEKIEEEKTFKSDVAHSEIGKKDPEYNYDDYAGDEDDYYYSDNSTENDFVVDKRTQNDNKFIPVKVDKKSSSTVSPKKNAIDESDSYDDDNYEDVDDDDDDEEEEEEDEDDSTINEEEQYDIDKIKDSKLDFTGLATSTTNCPRDCICERNFNSFMVATCSRLDAGIQKFDKTITDLEVVDIGPKYPIVLGDNFFKKIGLEHVESIKITNCTIEYLSPSAFAGLDKLYSLNLSHTGLLNIHPNAFTSNLRLKLLTLSGNDLSNMQHKFSPQSKYMLKAPSVEELDLSNCNLNSLLPTAFDELKNVVFINLSNNNLYTLPETIFNKVETIEEIDLSFNNIEHLPKHIFNKTSLAILNLQFNQISKNLDFVTSDLQRLNLGFCKIKNINSEMFKRLDGIYDLNLRGNSITKIHPMAFSSMVNLRNLDLSFNDIEQLSDLTFQHNRNLDVLKLNDNRRLRKLPAEGFAITHGAFDIYNLDISNCDISHIGENTFSTMPQITTLNLSFNNLNKTSKGIFSYLPRLIDLDMSFNYIEELNPFVFSHNKNLKKLKINGNPLKTLSISTFVSTPNLAELDVSECDLTEMWKESSSKNHPMKVMRKLKYLNISYNDIETIYQSDLEILPNLHVLDITNNNLKCDSYLKKIIKYLSKNHIKPSDTLKGRGYESYGRRTFFVGADELTWAEVAQIICKPDMIVDENLENEKIDNILNKNHDDGDDDENENDDEYDEDDVYDDDSSESAEDIQNGKDEIKDEGVKITETKDTGIDDYSEENIKENDKFGFRRDDDGELIIIESGSFYQNHYNWPMYIILTTALLIFVLMIKIVMIVMHRRGERYRQAILDSKNSIIYQKLSEEIAPQLPKVHKYQPIQQV